jgi:hypoxanthine phosphoribosyltransferase
MPNSPEVAAHMGGREVKRIVFSQDQIARRVAEMGREIADAYPPDEGLLVLGLLKGSFIFLADLVREIARPLHVDFLVASSYGSEMVSSGNVRLLYDPEASLEERRPRSLELCTLLHKRIAKNLVRDARWVGFDAPEEFLIGYGLDYSEDYRNLPFIASL